MAPRRPGEREGDVEQAKEWLQQALEWIGAGAKTAVGYGRFVVDQNRQEEWKQLLDDRKREQAKQARLSQMTPVEREMEEDGYQQDPDRFMKALTGKWLDRMESDDTPSTERMRSPASGGLVPDPPIKPLEKAQSEEQGENPAHPGSVAREKLIRPLSSIPSNVKIPGDRQQSQNDEIT